MENLEKDLNTILDHSTKETSRKIKDLGCLIIEESEVNQSVVFTSLVGDLSGEADFKEGYLFIKEANNKYSLPFEMLPEIVARFKRAKNLVNTEKQILSSVIKHDKRHLKYVLWFEITSFLKAKGVILEISKLNKYGTKNLGGFYYNPHLDIHEYVTDHKDEIKNLNKGMCSLTFNDISSFIQFYKEQTK